MSLTNNEFARYKWEGILPRQSVEDVQKGMSRLMRGYWALKWYLDTAWAPRGGKTAGRKMATRSTEI